MASSTGFIARNSAFPVFGLKLSGLVSDDIKNMPLFGEVTSKNVSSADTCAPKFRLLVGKMPGGDYAGIRVHGILVSLVLLLASHSYGGSTLWRRIKFSQGFCRLRGQSAFHNHIFRAVVTMDERLPLYWLLLGCLTVDYLQTISVIKVYHRALARRA